MPPRRQKRQLGGAAGRVGAVVAEGGRPPRACRVGPGVGAGRPVQAAADGPGRGPRLQRRPT
eukprot:1527834-Lingulodinium_polyedra.AAC.1